MLTLAIIKDAGRCTSCRDRPTVINASEESMRSNRHLTSGSSSSSEEKTRLPAETSVAAGHDLGSFGDPPLRTLLAKYHILDAVSNAKVGNANHCLNTIHAEPLVLPLAESVARLYSKTPRLWLVIRRSIRRYPMDILYAIVKIITDAKHLSEAILLGKTSNSILGPLEQEFACQALFDCIQVRKYALSMLLQEVQAFITGLSFRRVLSEEERLLYATRSSARMAPMQPRKRTSTSTQTSQDSVHRPSMSLQPILAQVMRSRIYGKTSENALTISILMARSKLTCVGLQQTLQNVTVCPLQLSLAQHSQEISSITSLHNR